MLPQSDPPYPEGVSTSDTSNPEVHRVATYPEALPGDGRQREQFCTITRLEKDDSKAAKARDMDFRKLILGDEKEDDESKASSGPLGKDGPADPNKDDWTARTSGAGGTQRKLWPRLRKSVAPSGVCTL
ncbi:hypothetical protein NDU88_002785 [Pleurodeles waltl]|uniref:Uncharacterized protein n=1 Tax=Pleurodeles waltl TaxID=8319 RepID=A0AAV7M713_PLEWA|nr:hypothetical protein NDU88_002785 [Pleurodeles waltl]